MENLYVVGERFGGGYPDGVYVAKLLEGKNANYYIIIGVLEVPSVRAVANSDAWSNAKVRKYESMIISPKAERTRQPLPYNGEWRTDTEDEYVDSLKRAVEKSVQRYTRIGDTQAVERCIKVYC